MKAKVCLIILIVLLAAVTAGCGNTVAEPARPEVVLPVVPADDISSDISPSEGQEVPAKEVAEFPAKPLIAIYDSNDKQGWKVFESSEHNVFVTEDWGEFTVSQAFDSIPYSFLFPGDLIFNEFSIFYDQNQNKTVEILPGVIFLNPGQDIWDKEPVDSNSDYRTALISEEAIAFNGLHGRKRVEKGSFFSHDGDDSVRDWFIHSYLVSNGIYAFAINFWEPDSMEPENTLWFDEVVSTFRFKDNEQEAETIEHFSITTALVGDKVAGMTIAFIEPFDDYAWIGFIGEATVTGRYTYAEDPFLKEPLISFFVDSESAEAIPQLIEDKRELWFCISNFEYASEVFGPLGSTGTATIIIDNYFLDFTPRESYNAAEIMNVIEITRD